MRGVQRRECDPPCCGVVRLVEPQPNDDSSPPSPSAGPPVIGCARLLLGDGASRTGDRVGDGDGHSREERHHTATLALLDFIQCTDATRCPTIAPGEEKGLPWNQVIGYAPNLDTYVLFWWQGPNTSAGPQSGQVVIHLHMHVMPVRAGIELLPPQTRKEDPAVLSDHAKRMISALGR